MTKKSLSIANFKSIKIEDKPIFDEHYKKYPPVHSDNNFTTLVSWMHYGKYKYTIKQKNLIILSQIDKQIRLRPATGEFNKNIMDEVIDLAKKQESDYPFGVIDKKTKEILNKNYPKMKFTSHRDYYDYVYLASDLVNLSGSKYSKIRNRLNKFKKNTKYKTEKIDENNIDQVKKFLKRWCIWKDCESDKILKAEKKAIFFSMNNFFELNLSGILITVKDKIEAISVFEKLNKNTALIHYEKGSPDYDGIYKTINNEAAKIIQKKFKYINRESDMGIQGLRKAKKSYRPHHMIKVYHVSKDGLIK